MMIKRILSRRSGFTLIELFVVMLIYGVLLAVAMPQIQNMRLMSSLESGQRAVGATLLRARWLAINKGTPYFVTLNGSNELQIRSGSSTGTVVNSTNLSDYSTTVDSFTPFGFDTRGFLPTSTTLTVRQATLGATKTVTVGLYGKVINS